MTGPKNKPAAGKVTAICGTVTLAEAADAFLSSPRCANPNTRRAYTGALDRLLAELGPTASSPPSPATRSPPRCEPLWGTAPRRPGTATGPPSAAWLTWCAASALARARQLPADAERRREHIDATRALPRARDRAAAVPPRRPAAGEDAVADAVRDRRPRQRGPGAERRGPRPGRPPRPDPLQGRRHRMDLLGLRHRAPAAPPAPAAAAAPAGRCSCPSAPRPARRPAPRDLCPHTGRARLGYDRARVLFTRLRPGGSCTSSATPRPPTSASRTSRSS